MNVVSVAPGPSEEQDVWRRRWRTSGVLAAAILLLYPVDRLIMGHWSLDTLGVRGAWAAEIVLRVVLWRRLGAPWEQRLTDLDSFCTGFFYLVLTALTGGKDSLLFPLLPTVPLIVALTNPRKGRGALLCGLLCTLGVVGLLLARGQATQALTWGMMTSSATFFGMYSSAQYGRMQDAVHALERERDQRVAQGKLAMAERQRVQAEKLATVGRLAANVVHEINNPLAFVRSNLEFLNAEVLQQTLAEGTREELREVFDETRQGVERIRQIVSDLRGFSHMDVEEPSECALADVVTDAARLAAVRLKNVARLTVVLPPELPEVFATRRRLSQVVLNLLVNAGDALEEARVPNAEVRVTGLAQGERVALLVEDNGPGFPPHVLPRLFESFFTTKGPEKGTGLGLALSRELVEHCGGTLIAENRPEGGARLRLELPMHPRPGS